jgi:hypothetical protein
VVDHLTGMAEKYHIRIFYLSEDSVSPRTLTRLAGALHEAGHDLKWATDVRPEAYLNGERCRELAAGGCLAVSLGIESASPRILGLINKGISVEEARTTVTHLANAGLAVEAMVFTQFPGETLSEALTTVRFLEAYHPYIALFMCGEFYLTNGSRIALHPEAFNIREIWRVSGDTFLGTPFYEEHEPPKSPADFEKLAESLEALSTRWYFRHYPWAGSLSTAHTLLWYDRFGPHIFKELAQSGENPYPKEKHWTSKSRFDIAELEHNAREWEERIWHHLIYEKRHVSPEAYRELASAAPSARPKPGRWLYAPGVSPQLAERRAVRQTADSSRER